MDNRNIREIKSKVRLIPIGMTGWGLIHVLVKAKSLTLFEGYIERGFMNLLPTCCFFSNGLINNYILCA